MPSVLAATLGTESAKKVVVVFVFAAAVVVVAAAAAAVGLFQLPQRVAFDA